MNKKRISQILAVLILLGSVNFKPNFIYADEIIGNENVASGSNLKENKEPELLETYNITEKINITKHYNFSYDDFNFHQECMNRMIRLTNENNLIFSDLRFDKDKNLYYFEATKRTEDDQNSSDYDKLKNLENRKKYRMYVNIHNFFFDNGLGNYDSAIYYIKHDFLNENWNSNYKKEFKTNYIKYKDGNYIYAILKDEYDKEYKVYTNPIELNEFIKSNLVISKEELENEEINESIDSIKSELKEINESPYYFVNLEIKSNKIKNDNGKSYIEVLDKISNKTYKLHVNTYEEITIEVPYELRYKKYYEEGGEVYLKTFTEEKRNEINEKIKNILGENFFTYNTYDNPYFQYISFYKYTKNKKPEYEASILYETENEPKKFLKVKFITNELHFTQNIGLQKDEEISKENEKLIINWYKNQMINVNDFVFLNKMPKKENDRYYYDVKVTYSDGTESITKLYIDQKLYQYPEDYNVLNEMDKNQPRINFPSNRFNQDNLLLTDDEINEIKNKFLKFQKNIYFNIKSVNVNKNVGTKNNKYWVQVEIKTDITPYSDSDHKIDINLPIYNEEKKETFLLYPINTEDIPKYYISKDGTYIYFGEKNDGIGIPLNEYIKDDLRENEKIEKINFSEYKNFIRYTIRDDLNNERLIDIPLSKDMGIAARIGVPKYSIKLEDSVKNTRKTTERDKEIISKIFKDRFKGLIQNIKISDEIFGQDVRNKRNAYTFIEINPKDNEPLNINDMITYTDNNHYYYKILLTSNDVDVLCEFACPPAMRQNTEEPSLTCSCTSEKPRPINPEDFPDPEEPKHNEPTPKVTPSDLPKTTPSNIPKNPTPSTRISTPPTVTNRTPITVIEPKQNEETNQIENKDPVNSKQEVKSESRITRNIKTSDNLFILLSLFSGFFMLFYFSFIKLNRKKEE